MSNEIQVRSSLGINNGNLQYQSRPTSFNADMAGLKGPTPGAISVPSAGVAISLAALDTLGGVCFMQNLDSLLTVEYGVYVTSLARFIPFGEMLPGECYVLRLSSELGHEYTDTGTGSTGSIDSFWMKVRGPHGTGSAIVRVEAFDK